MAKQSQKQRLDNQEQVSVNEELEVLKIVTQRLNTAGISYMISGSMAANYYTVPRMTRDIDIVIELEEGKIKKFVGLFKKDFYIDVGTVEKEVQREGMFNLIHSRFLVKVDFIIKKASAYQDSAFSRKKEIIVEKSRMHFISPEDLIISKLNWAKDSRSEMQIKDIKNLIKTVDNIDFNYIGNWVAKLGLEGVYKEARQ